MVLHCKQLFSNSNPNFDVKFVYNYTGKVVRKC
jgi:hypothetical protein